MEHILEPWMIEVPAGPDSFPRFESTGSRLIVPTCTWDGAGCGALRMEGSISAVHPDDPALAECLFEVSAVDARHCLHCQDMRNRVVLYLARWQQHQYPISIQWEHPD